MKLKNVKKILLVDDNEMDNFISKRIIELSGFKGEVIVKDSGKGALNYLQENQDKPENIPELIFLDISMPVVDGFVFLHEWQKLNENVTGKSKIVVLTSSDNKYDMDRFLVNDFVIDFITKPITLETFRDLVEIEES